MYSSEYYKSKKDKVLRKIQISKDNFLQRQIDETNRFLGDQKGFQEDMNEINAEEQESKKATEKKPKVKPVEEKKPEAKPKKPKPKDVKRK